MNRRVFLESLLAGAGMTWFAGARPLAGAHRAIASLGSGRPVDRLDKPRAEWRQLLSPAQYSVLFEEATERSFSSPLDKEKRAGTFLCAACFLPLFSSQAKFDSGTGWPSFTEPLPEAVDTRRDFRLILPRTEYHCARCSGHQGHVFKDGPRPTGQRWCNNGVALRFVPKGESLPALRS